MVSRIGSPHGILLSLSAILLLALILRIAALMDLKGSAYFDFPLGDERYYHTWAMQIAEGTFKSQSAYRFSPLPAYVSALIYRIFSPDILYVRILNIVFGVLTCALVYLIGREMANHVTGLIACLIGALYKPFIFYSIVPLKTSLSVFLMALTVYLFVAVLNRGSPVKALLIGVAVGLMFNVRGNSVILVPVIPLLFLFNTQKQRASFKGVSTLLVVYLLGLALSTGPFAIRNYRASGNFVLSTPQSGFALYVGNNPQNPDPYYRPVPFAWPSPYEQMTQFTIEASRRAGQRLSRQEASAYWARETLKVALEHPAAFLGKIFQKSLVLVNEFEAGDHYDIGFVSQFVKFFKLPFIPLSVILPLGIAGMVLSARRSHRFLCVGLVFVFYASTLILFFTCDRFRLPLLVILIPFAVMGINDLFSWVRGRQWRRVLLYSCLTLSFLVIEFLPVQGTGDMTAYYNTHAIILDTNGRENEALQYWEASSKMERPYSTFANLSLAGKALGRGDIQKALGYLDKIPDASFAAAYKYEMMGDVMMIQGRTDRAIAAYERSLDINSGQRGPRQKLVKLYWRVDREKALREFETLEYVSSFYDFLQTPAFGGGSRNRN